MKETFDKIATFENTSSTIPSTQCDEIQFIGQLITVTEGRKYSNETVGRNLVVKVYTSHHKPKTPTVKPQKE